MANIVRQVTVFCKRNSATILTVMGGAGVIATAIMAAKATPKALTMVEKVKEEKNGEVTVFETIRVTAPVYIPTVVTGVATVACIFGANVLNKRKQASLVSAYALLDNAFKEYKKKVDELYGEGANYRINEEMAKDKYEEMKIEVEKELFYDSFSGQYFESTSDAILNAAYKANKQLAVESYLCLNELYDMMGVPEVEGGDEIGWSIFAMVETTWYSWLDFHIEKTVMDDGLECGVLYLGIDPCAEFLTDY